MVALATGPRIVGRSVKRWAQYTPNRAVLPSLQRSGMERVEAISASATLTSIRARASCFRLGRLHRPLPSATREITARPKPDSQAPRPRSSPKDRARGHKESNANSPRCTTPPRPSLTLRNTRRPPAGGAYPGYFPKKSLAPPAPSSSLPLLPRY